MSSHADFGRYLKQQRELRGLSLQDIARSTKIPPTLLGALEDGQAERLPERVFVVHSLRSYARVVGLSPEDTVNRFQEIPGVPQAEAFDPQAMEEERQARASAIAWAVVASVLLLGAAFALHLGYQLALKSAMR